MPQKTNDEDLITGVFLPRGQCVLPRGFADTREQVAFDRVSERNLNQYLWLLNYLPVSC
jgi:hypothetical protein